MTHGANGVYRETKVKGQTLGSITSFKYLRIVVSDDGSKPESLSRVAQGTAALIKMTPIGEITTYLLDQDEVDALPCHFRMPFNYGMYLHFSIRDKNL